MGVTTEDFQKSWAVVFTVALDASMEGDKRLDINRIDAVSRAQSTARLLCLAA
jgi:hypothetical protein